MKHTPRTPSQECDPRQHAQRGSAMVMAIFVLVLLTAMGTTLLFTTQNEVRMSQANLRVKQAFYLAEAGVEDARRTLYDANGAGDFNDELYAAGGGTTADHIEVDPAALGATFASDGTPTTITGAGDDVPLRPLTALTASTAGGGWYAAFLSNDPIDGTASTTDGNDRVMLTSIGIAADRSTEVVQAIVEPHKPLPFPPGSTITLLGGSPSFTSGSSNPSVYSGDDCNGSGAPGLYTPIVGTIGSDAESDAESGVWTNNGPDFDSGGQDWDDTVSDLTDPSDPAVAASGFGTVDPAWTDCQGLIEMIETLRPAADILCEGPGVDSCSIAGLTLGEIGFVDGNYSLGSPESGGGILVVTGTLLFHGGASWEGILLVVGEGKLLRNGAGSGQISGTVIVADVAGDDNIYGTDDDCGSGPDGFGASTFQVNGGGNGDITYCQDHIQQANPVTTYRIVEFVQR